MSAAPLTMPTEAREPQGDDRAERETASAVHPDEAHAGVLWSSTADGAATCAVDVPALQRQRPVSGPSVGIVSGSGAGISPDARLSAMEDSGPLTARPAGHRPGTFPEPPGLIRCDSREEWLAARRSLVTASDAAAILGCSPWGSALSVYAEKVGAAEGLADNPLLRRGRRMQDLVLDEYMEATGNNARPEPEHVIRLHHDYPWLGASLDAECAGSHPDEQDEWCPLELKTGGDWSEWEGDRAPVQYEVQLQIQMAVTGARYGTLACLRSLRDEAPLVRDRERDDDFLAAALPALQRFHEHLARREPPPACGWPGELQAAKKLWRGPQADDTVDFSRVLHRVEGWELARQRERVEKARGDEHEAALWLALADAKFGALPDGSYIRGRVFRNGARVLDRWTPRSRRTR